MHTYSKFKLIILAFSVLFSSLVISKEIPSPDKQNIEVITHANVSTLKTLDVYFADQQIPKNYAGEKISNVTGFSWYVSKHFALQTDFDSAKAKKALQVLEMAYPHWVNYINDEPADMHNTRIPIVFATDWERIKETTKEYGFMKSPVINGEMMYYNSTAYAHNANPLYLLLHEGFHAFADVFRHGLKTGWFTEGAAQDSAHYVINDDWTQVAVFVFDRGHYNKWRKSMEEWRKNPPKVEGFTQWGPPYNAGATIQHFMKDDPLRNQYWKIWAKQLDTDFFSQNNHQSLADNYSDQLLYSLFGSKDKFKEAWENWLTTIELTTQSNGRWGREGNRVFLNKVKDEHPENGYIVYQLPMGSKASNNPLALDYFPAKPSDLIGKVARGGKSPTIGVLLEDITVGKSGIGLFTNADNNTDSMIKVMVEDKSQLIFDGTAIGGEKIIIPFPAKMLAELNKNPSSAMGLTVKLNGNLLTATLKTNNAQFASQYTLPKDAVSALRQNAIALVVENNSKTRLTPYFDDGRPSYESYLKPAPMNKWRNPGDGAFGRVVEANWLLGEESPKALQEIQQTLYKAASSTLSKQQKALKLFEQQSQLIAKAVMLSTSEKAPQALLALSGLRLKTSWQDTLSKNKVAVTATIKNPSNSTINGRIFFNVDKPLAVLNKNKYSENIEVKANSEITITKVFDRNPKHLDSFDVFIDGQIQWNKQVINLSDKIRSTPWPGLTLLVDKNIITEDKNTITVNSQVFADDDFSISGKITYQVTPESAVKNPLVVINTRIASMNSQKIPVKFQLKEGGENFTIKVTGDFYIDSEPYHFVKEVEYK